MDNIHDTPVSANATVTANYALNGKIMLGSVVILFGAVAAVIFLHTYARCFFERRRNRPRSFHGRHIIPGVRQPTGVNIAEAVHAAHLAYQAREEKKDALDPSLLKTLPTFLFSPAKPPRDGAVTSPPDCAVCLSELEDGERCRALPACGHTFHAACIDAWFGSHSSCPLCRSPVEREPAAAAAPSSADIHVEIAVSETEPTRDGEPEEPVSSPAGPGLPGEWSDRKPRDLAGLALVDDQITVSGLGNSTERNRVKLSMKRIWSI